MTARMSAHFQVIIWYERVAQGERAKAEMKEKKKRILTLIPVDLEWIRLQYNYNPPLVSVA